MPKQMIHNFPLFLHKTYHPGEIERNQNQFSPLHEIVSIQFIKKKKTTKHLNFRRNTGFPNDIKIDQVTESEPSTQKEKRFNGKESQAI